MPVSWLEAMGIQASPPACSGERSLLGHRLVLPLRDGPMTMRDLHAATGRVVSGRDLRAALAELQRAGVAAVRRGAPGPRGGYSLHAAIRVGESARDRLEKLCRYLARPVLAQDRLSVAKNGRIVYSMQGEYTRRSPSRRDPNVARGGKPLSRVRILNRTPARGAIVRSSAFLNTLLHEFCHHYDAEALGLQNSFHTAGFYARIRHVREQIGIPAQDDSGRDRPGGGRSRRPAVRSSRTAPEIPGTISPSLARLWAIIRGH